MARAGSRAPVEGLTAWDMLWVLADGAPWSVGESSAIVGTRAGETGNNVVAYRSLDVPGAAGTLHRSIAQLYAPPSEGWREMANLAYLATGEVPALPLVGRLRDGDTVFVVAREGVDGPSLLGNAQTVDGPSLVWRNPTERAILLRVEGLATAPPGAEAAPVYPDGLQARAFFRLRVLDALTGAPAGRFLGLVRDPTNPGIVADIDYVAPERAAVFVYGHLN